jgi:hypothetical protein
LLCFYFAGLDQELGTDKSEPKKEQEPKSTQAVSLTNLKKPDFCPERSLLRITLRRNHAVLGRRHPGPRS